MGHEAGRAATAEEVLPAIGDVVMAEEDEQHEGPNERQRRGQQRERPEGPEDDDCREGEVVPWPALVPVHRPETDPDVRQIAEEINKEQCAEQRAEESEVRDQRASAPRAQT